VAESGAPIEDEGHEQGERNKEHCERKGEAEMQITENEERAKR